jgi:hypothetical protein
MKERDKGLEVLRKRDKDVFIFMRRGAVVSQKIISSGVDFVVKSPRFETIQYQAISKVQGPEAVLAHETHFLIYSLTLIPSRCHHTELLSSAGLGQKETCSSPMLCCGYVVTICVGSVVSGSTLCNSTNTESVRIFFYLYLKLR